MFILPNFDIFVISYWFLPTLLILCDRCYCNNICIITITSVTQNQQSWQKSITNDKYVKIWQYKHPKLYIITFHIHHQKWVLWQGKHFPIHRMKPCQMDWRKLVVLEKCILLKRILVISLKIKQNEKLTCLYSFFIFVKAWWCSDP